MAWPPKLCWAQTSAWFLTKVNCASSCVLCKQKNEKYLFGLIGSACNRLYADFYFNCDIRIENRKLTAQLSLCHIKDGHSLCKMVQITMTLYISIQNTLKADTSRVCVCVYMIVYVEESYEF